MMYKKILVTGSTGFLGRHILASIQKAFAQAQVVGVGRKDYDLLVDGHSERMLADVQPDLVIHLAAKVGGIIANRKYPADFFYENITMNTRLFHAAWKAGVKKFVTLMGGCSYPAMASSPIGEEQMWAGYPQKESAAYSVAKKMMLVQSQAYREQYGFDSVVLIPGNVYGEYDNFNEEYSHVIPAMIRRFIEARDRGADPILCFGTGRPTRDFVYAGDVAAVIPWFVDHYDSSDPVNISSGTRISILELAETMRAATGYQGRIEWDTSKPDGQIDKIFDVTRLHQLGLACPTSLREGLVKTATWFLEARRVGGVRL